MVYNVFVVLFFAGPQFALLSSAYAVPGLSLKSIGVIVVSAFAALMLLPSAFSVPYMLRLRILTLVALVFEVLVLVLLLGFGALLGLAMGSGAPQGLQDSAVLFMLALFLIPLILIGVAFRTVYRAGRSR